jgi:hypothetical protein
MQLSLQVLKNSIWKSSLFVIFRLFALMKTLKWSN